MGSVVNPDFSLELYAEQEARQRVIAYELSTQIANSCVVISDYTQHGVKNYKKNLIDVVYGYIKEGFEYDFLRRVMVNFKFTPEGDIYQLELTHFITNVIMWMPIVKLDEECLDESYIVDCTRISNDTIKYFIDTKIIIPFRDIIENRKLNMLIHDMIYELSRISDDFNIIMGLTINIETFIDMANRNPEFKEILYTNISDDMQPSEIEDLTNHLTDRQIEILKDDEKGNCLQPILLSGTGIKTGQYKEFAINYGLKPDLSGSTIPIPVNTNFVRGGIDSVTAYFIDSLGGRKSLIMNSTVMGTSGYFNRRIMLITSDVVLRKDDKDCGTLHSVKFHISEQEHLDRLVLRYYRLPYERQYKVLRGDETHLIGQDIFVRSPAKCASREGICRKCYGELFANNRELRSVGAFAATEVGEPVSQSILSSKHLLTTRSVPVEFNDEFYDLFAISANEVMLDSKTEKDIGDYTLVIIKNNIIKLDEIGDSGITSYIPLFHIRNNKTGEMTEIKELKDKDLYISPEFEDVIAESYKRRGRAKAKKGDGTILEIPLVNINFNEPIFLIEIENNELTRPLYDIMGLLDSEEKRKQFGITTVDQMVQQLLNLLIISKISAASVHGEVIIRSIIRSKSNILDIPDFRSYSAIDDIQILTIKSALKNHPSVTLSLSFQELRKQVSESPLTFKKTAGSYVDPLFRQTLE